MKKFVTVLPLLAIFLMTSCDKYAEVKQLMADLATAVSSGDKSAVVKIYPDASKADSLKFTFDAEKAQFEEIEKGWKIVISDGVDLVVEKNESDGSLTVKESHGVFAISKSQKDFALKTGWISKDMNDAKIAEQLSDTAFVSYVSGEFLKTFKEKFRIKKTSDNRSDYASDWTGGGEWFVTIANDLDIDVSGTDYQVVITSPVQRGKEEVLEGKDIYAGSQETLKSSHLDDTFYVDYRECIDAKNPKIKLDIKLSTIDILNKYFVPKGDEYNNYLKQK